MQGTILGVTRMSGVGKESKKAYDMARALVMNPLEAFQNDTMKREGYGFEVIEIELNKDSFEFFKVQKYPLTGLLVLEQQVRAGKLQSVLVGYEPKKAAA